MSNTPVPELPAQELSSGSGQTSPSRPFQPISDPSASKRVCFYKSGDYKFSGHRMVINARTFKTFDALLDALSKKVPLPFGVRTITTPRGTRLVKALDDFFDGGSYVCSDQKRVKPLNLDEVSRRQVPWNTTRPFSAGRRRRQGFQFGRRNDNNRPAKVTERVAVRTPKKLLVMKNRDPTVKRTIVLQRRTAPTFDALLDYLSQILQFPVLKLFSTDGRRVDGLATLILCSGVVVAAGNESFKLGNYSFHRTGQMAQVMYMDTVEPSMLQPTAQNDKSFSSGRGSRNFSLSSERYIVNQINKSRNGSMNHNRSFETEVNHRHTPMETCGTGRVDNEHHTSIVPQDDDIEKSFRVNQDGSMTVEMKVRLTIKEEEMLHWTTTLSRSSLSKRTLCASISESGNSSPDSNNAVAKESSSISEDESKEENYTTGGGKGVGFNDDRVYEGYTSTALGKAKTGFKRTPTPGPGPQHVKKKASIESVKTVTESGVQESTLGHYSYMERTADGETTEGYCVVRHSSSNRPIPKPRKTASAGASNKGSHSSIRSPGVAEVLQIQNNGMEVTETVMHIYESQGCYDNYFANEEYSADGVPFHGSTPAPESKPSTDSGPRSSSNDCDIDFSWQPPTTDSLQRQKEEMLSLSSEPITSTHVITKNWSSVTEHEAQTATNSQERVKKDRTPKSEKKKKMIKPARNQKTSTSTSGSDKKQKESPSKNSKHSSKEKLSSNTSVGKKSLSSSESAKSGQKSRGPEKPQIKKASKDENMSRKEQALLVNTENVVPPKRQNINKAAAKDNGHNVNTPTGRPQMKKNMLDILQPKKSLMPGKKTIGKPKSMIESRIPSPKKSLELSESFSMPSLNPSPSEIHQYVENWLENVGPDPVSYTEEVITDESEPRTKVVFQIGGDSESDEKNECQTNLDECYPSPSDAVKTSASCLSVPLCHAQTTTALLHNEQYVRGLCVSMPSVRVDPVQQENRLRSHKSAEAICPADDEPSSSTSNILSPKAKIKPVLRQLCSSIQCIRGASDTNTTSNLEKSSSLPDFPTQVASVFGSSCKAFVSFLSVMTLRDNLKGSAPGDGNQSRSTSEAMLMMESLQKISAIEDEEGQRASLTDLQSRASSQFRERWKDFQILRERFESEPLSPKVSETEFALDVFSEGGDAFEDQHLCIDELMEELNMPQDLRDEISSTIQQAKSFYPVEESTFVEVEGNQSDSEEDVEKFVEECDNDTKQSPEPDNTCITEDITQTKQGDDNGEIDSLKKMQSVCSEQAKESEISETEIVDRDREEEAEEGAATEEKMENERQEEWESENGSREEEESAEKVEEGTDEEMTVGEEEEEETLDKGEKEVVEETEEGLLDEEDQESRVDDSDEETDEEENGEEGETEEKQGEEIEVEAEVIEENNEEEEMKDYWIIEDKDEEEEAESMIEEEEEEEETDAVTQKDVEEEVIEEEDEEEEMEEVIEEGDEEHVEEKDEDQTEVVSEESNEEEDEEEEEETDAVTQKDVEEEVIEEGDEEHVVEEKDEDQTEVVSEENNEEEDEEEEEREQEEQEDEEDVEVKNIEQRVITDEEEDKTDTNIEEEEKCDEGEESMKELEKTGNSLEEESAEEKEILEEIEIEENMKAGQMQDEEEREDDEEENESNEGLDQVEKQESKDEVEEENVTNDAESISGGVDCKSLLEEASYLQQQSSCEEEADVDVEVAEHNTESPTKYSSEGQCEDDKGNGTDTINELETEEGGEHHEETSSSLPHPVEISQELLDFVNSALQSSSLIFTYDTQGNIRIEPDNARVVQTKQTAIPKSREDISYRLKRLPSPITSDLSDYRPETSESGGYKTQESVDIVTESEEEASPVCRSRTDTPNGRTNVERANSKLSVASNSVLQNSQLKSGGSFSSFDSSTKASREDLSYFSGASSQKADATEATQCISFTSEKDSIDGVLIDQGRWLLKENHLIRKSPPISLGMYGNVDSTSIDTGQDSSVDSSPHHEAQHNPLAAISSSELEEMAKPQTPNCTYYNMPHGSDSDPFLDDSSVKSRKKDSSSVKGRGFRVSPTIDTSKTWANKNGSLSSFASVEFKIPDRKVHPEGESSAVTQARRTSSGGGSVLQAQDSLETLHVRCGQYCPIL